MIPSGYHFSVRELAELEICVYSLSEILLLASSTLSLDNVRGAVGADCGFQFIVTLVTKKLAGLMPCPDTKPTWAMCEAMSG